MVVGSGREGVRKQQIEVTREVRREYPKMS